MRSGGSYTTAATDTPQDGALGVNVDTTGVQVVAANPDRVELSLTNISDEDIYIGLGEIPVASAATATGVCLKAGGGSYVFTSFKGIVYARHAGSGNKRLTGVDV